MAPDRVGPYLVDRKIGAGGMGTVYLAHHAETGRPAAVKILPAALAREEGFVARFAREIEALEQLKNPHIVELLDSGTDHDTYYYAMEYVDGETLTARLRRVRRLPWHDVIDITIQVCSALRAAHNAGIIHRDLKPSNLMITADGAVKLTDFGVAHVFAGTKLTATGGVIGTAEYMSPEQASGKRVTKQSDLYSLGAVMYVMLTGRPPFTGKSVPDVLNKHQYGVFDRPSLYVPEIPHWLEELVCRLLEKEPDKRFPDAHVLARELETIKKKVELSASEQTLATAELADGSHVGSAATVTAEVADSASDAPRGERGPGPGTLMRDLMRVEIERTLRRSAVGEWLEKTWVLVLLLAALVAGGVIWFRTRDLPADEKFARGEALMEQPAGDDWLTARDDYFAPLLASDSETWEPRVRPHLRRIEAYDFTRELAGPRLGRRHEPANEIERFLLLAQRYREMGDYGRAERTLDAVGNLLPEDDRERYADAITHMREDLQSRRAAATEETPLLAESIARAEEAWNDGEHERAADIWRSVIELYGRDPDFADEVERARKALNRMTSGEDR